jgi:sigma-70-like protein
MDRQIVSRIGDMLLLELPFKQRAALLLSRVDGFDHCEAARCLGVSKFAVKSLVFRATRTLREHMQEPAVESVAKPPGRHGVGGQTRSKRVDFPRRGPTSPATSRYAVPASA